MADVRALGEKSPIVFRGRVATVGSEGVKPRDRVALNSVAKFEVDRLYRGKPRTEASIYFLYGGRQAGINGHYCIDFQPDTYWLVFAVESRGRMELFDDCEGALAISPLLGKHLNDSDWLTQMQADFLAGLNDSSSAARVLSIQRLGGLRLPSSRGTLHRVIETGDKNESEWAMYAALRTGDVTVLPKVKELLAGLAVGDHDSPARAISLELQHVTDGTAVPELIAILDSTPDAFTRTTVLVALGENLRDRRAVPSLAAHLSDPDRYALQRSKRNQEHNQGKGLYATTRVAGKRCRTANLALPGLVGAVRQVSRLESKLKHRKSVHLLRLRPTPEVG
jgi:hypothetical protein